jgi:hypothetical protein
MPPLKQGRFGTLESVAGTAVALFLFGFSILFLFFPDSGFVQFFMGLITDDDLSTSSRRLAMPIALIGLLSLIWAGQGKWWD